MSAPPLDAARGKGLTEMRLLLRRLRIWFITVPEEPRSALRVYRWWGARWPFYNVWLAILGTPGLAIHVAAVRLATGQVPALEDIGSLVGWIAFVLNVLYCVAPGFEIDRYGLRPSVRDRDTVGPLLELWCWFVSAALTACAVIELLNAVRIWTHGA